VIPFTYKLKGSPDQIKWMDTRSTQIQIPLESNEDKWIYGNLNYMGYFRVNYDKENWNRIIDQLKVDHTVFSTTERAGLIFDSFTLARAGYVDYIIPLQLASYLVKETEYVPWKSYFKSITYIDNLLSLSTCYGLFQVTLNVLMKSFY
jgi:aminopeptidase N